MIEKSTTEWRQNEMKFSTWKNGLICGSALALLAGLQANTQADSYNVRPITPAANEQVIRDHLIIIVDESGSIGSGRKYRFEKDLVQAFTQAMPAGDYMSGIDSFAGVPSKLWLDERLAVFVSTTMTDGADDLEALGKTTPLARSIWEQKWEMRGKGRYGRGAILVFSDGKVENPEVVLQACRDLQVDYGGELCVFTVQIGDSDRGRDLLQDMAEVNGCGKYYDGNLLTTEASIHGLARDIFLGARPIVVSRAQEEIAPIENWSLNNILFDNDSSVIGSAYHDELDKAAMILKYNPTVRIALVGHTDSNATNAYNQKLSERRVNAAKAALVQRGANPSQFNISAYGETRPEVPNTSPANLHTNRRVELQIVKSVNVATSR